MNSVKPQSKLCRTALALTLSLVPMAVAELPANASPLSNIVSETGGKNCTDYVVTGGVTSKAQAQKTAAKAKAKGFSAYVKQRAGGWTVQLGAFKCGTGNAERLLKKAKAAGFSGAFIY